MNHDLLQAAVEASEAGARVLRSTFRSADLQVTAKAANDWVSEADRASEAAVTAVLRERFPRHEVLGEEGGLSGEGHDGYRWLVDPLDGTTNFLRGLPFFCISVACRRGRETVAGVVLDPLRNDLFTAARGGGASWNGRKIKVSGRTGLDGACLATGFPFRAKAALERYLHTFQGAFARAGAIRRCGAAALDLAYTAAGIFDGFWELRLSPWDVAAGALLIEEAGGRVTDLDGGDGYLVGGNVVGGSPAVHGDLLELLGEHVSEEIVDRLVPVSREEAPAATEV